ncbi:MAG: hypothetical protein H0X17_04720 [Deltaproteobacteria bacterium]|nr:hypothetical protein [Deltaproteobacteria bacterium]
MVGERRIEQLAARVAWLDRYRRLLSIGLALAIAPVLIYWLTDWLPAEWPGAHLVAIGVMLGVVLWYVIEVGFAWLTAVWETECAQLDRTPLPRAQLRKK